MFPKLPDLDTMAAQLQETSEQMALLVDGIGNITALLTEQNRILTETRERIG